MRPGMATAVRAISMCTMYMATSSCLAPLPFKRQGFVWKRHSNWALCQPKRRRARGKARFRRDIDQRRVREHPTLEWNTGSSDMRQNVGEILEDSRLELLRRANTRGNIEAWTAFQQSLEATVLSWFHDHPRSKAACRLQSEGQFVTLA